MAEVLDIHEADGSSCQQADDGGSQDSEDASCNLVILVLDDYVRNPYHHNERQPNYRDCGEYAAEYSKEMGRPYSLDERIVNDSRIANVGGTVDADRTWCLLANGYDVSELSFGNPCLFDDNLLFDE